jgi:hypothetical protein
LSPHYVNANDAPIKLISGGATPTSLGVKNIRMESEVVKITLGEKSFVVDATFVFMNSGDSAQINVGFPKRGFGNFREDFKNTSDFINFETWIDDKKVEFAEKPETSSIEGGFTLPELIQLIKTDSMETSSLFVHDYRWMVKYVDFPARKKTTTRVRYEAPYQYSGYCLEAHYIYGTGAYWEGKIGKSTFIVDTTNADGDEVASFPDKRKKSGIKRIKLKKGVIQYVISNFKPETDEEIVAFTDCDEN